MTEQEKNDREQLEYLKQWQEKKKQKCKKTVDQHIIICHFQKNK